MKNYLLNGYEILVPPYPLAYDEWTKKTAMDYLQWYTTHIPERVAYLSQKALGYTVNGKIAPETLVDIWKWFFKAAEIEAVPPKIIQQQREYFAQFGESFVSKTRFTARTEYILRDIAMYMSAVFTTNHLVLHWDIINKPKRHINYNQPVLKGFLDMRHGKPFENIFPPDHMISVQAARYCDGCGSINDLLALYLLWEQDIPQ